MTSDQLPPAGLPGQRARQRPATTIDLKATEIAREPAAAADASADAGAQAAAAATPPHPRAEPSEPRTGARASGPGQPTPKVAWLPPNVPWRVVGAGAAGAVLMLILVWIAGLFSGGDIGMSGLDGRLASVEKELRALAARQAPPAIDPKAIDELSARLAKVETALASPRPPALDPALHNRIAAVEGETRALGERVGVVARRTDDIAVVAADARTRAEATAAALAELSQRIARQTPTADRGEVERLGNRVAALERTAKSLEAEIARRADEPGDRSVRLALVAAALKTAIDRGEPFVTELNTAKSLGGDTRVLATLEPFASSGVPTAAALGRELSALLPVLAQAASTVPRDGSYLQKLQAGAEKLVRIRPLDDVPGDDAAAVLARLELRAAQSDLAGALAELAKLPAPARAPAHAWIARVQARNAALDAGRRFAADAFTALGKPSP